VGAIGEKKKGRQNKGKALVRSVGRKKAPPLPKEMMITTAKKNKITEEKKRVLLSEETEEHVYAIRRKKRPFSCSDSGSKGEVSPGALKGD